MAWKSGFEERGREGTDLPAEQAGPRSKSDWALLRRLLHYFGNDRNDLIIMGISVVVFTVAGAFGPVLTADAIDWHVYPNGSVGSDVTGLTVIVLAYVGVTALAYFAEYVQTYIMSVAGQDVVYRLRKDAVENLQRLSLRYYDQRPIGATTSYVTNDVDVLNNFLTFQSTQLISGFIDRGYRHRHVLRERRTRPSRPHDYPDAGRAGVPPSREDEDCADEY